MATVCVGCGLAVDGASGLLEVQLRPGGGISCDDSGDADDGLFLTVPAASAGDCITVSAGGAVSVEISPDACNGLKCRGNGLYIPCPTTIAGTSGTVIQTGAAPPFDAAGPNATFNFPSPVINITNNLCCSVSGRISIIAGGLFATLEPSTECYYFLQTNANGGGLVGVSPETRAYRHNVSTTVVQTVDFNNIEDNNWYTIPAGTAETYAANFVLFVITGTAHVTGNVGFEFIWDLPLACGCAS